MSKNSTNMKQVLRLAAAVMLLLFVCATVQAQTSAPQLASERANPSAATADAPPADQSKLSFLHLLAQGGWAMIPLALCSLIGVALIIERGLALRRSEIIPPAFFPGLDKVYRSPADTESGLTYCKRNHPPSGASWPPAFARCPLVSRSRSKPSPIRVRRKCRA